MEYSPNKKYTWTPNDEFSLKGEEFGIILNCLRVILNSPEAQRIVLAQQANVAIENILANAVEKGIVKEMEEPSAMNSPKMELVK